MLEKARVFPSASLVLSVAAFMVGCGGPSEPEPGVAPGEPKAGPPEAPGPGEVTDPAGSAAVSGIVTFAGEAPRLRPINMSADPACAAKHSEPAPSEVLVLGDGNTLGNVFVRPKSGLPQRTWPTPSEPVVMDQNGCRYSPRVMGIMVGQPFKILNSDGLLHNVHALPKVNREFNMAMPANRTEAVETFGKTEEIFKIKCDVHPWMNAYIAVLDHPYFAVTGTDGTFALEGLPAGTYEIEAWHERLGAQTASVTVADGETATANFEFTR